MAEDWQMRALAAEKKCRAYKSQLRQLTLIHRLIKREWLDGHACGSRAMNQFYELERRHGNGTMANHELVWALRRALEMVEKARRGAVPQSAGPK